MSNKAKENIKGLTRRDFIKATAATACAVSMIGTTAAEAEAKGTGIPIDLSGYRLDRTRALTDGEIKIDGVDLNYTPMGIGDINTHLFSGPQTLGITEVGLHPFMLAYANQGFRDYWLLPIFPLRTFRHKNVFIRTDRGIKNPLDLRGKKVATAGYSSTSLTWIRGIYQQEYGLKPEDMEWIISQEDSSANAAGKVSAQESMAPKGIPISMGPVGKSESDLLAEGAVDAVFHAAEPQCYIDGHPKVARLFEDSRAEEQAFFKKTGIFPIMHAVAIRKDLAEAHPWLVEAAFKAYSQAKQKAYDYLTQKAWFDLMLPWAPQEYEETKKLMGDNYFSYGVEANRKTLEALFRYSYEQKLAKKVISIEEIFAPSSLKLVE